MPPSPAEMPGPYLVREAAPALIYATLAGVRAFDAILHQATLEQFHALRIEFEAALHAGIFQEVLGEDVKAVINEIKKLQDHLGDLNDANVASGILRDFSHSGMCRRRRNQLLSAITRNRCWHTPTGTLSVNV